MQSRILVTMLIFAAVAMLTVSVAVPSADACGTLIFADQGRHDDNFWCPGMDPHVVVGGPWVGASPDEDVQWQSVSLSANGSGDDAADIASVDIRIDVNNDGKVDPAVDEHIGSGKYPVDNATNYPIYLSPTKTIHADLAGEAAGSPGQLGLSALSRRASVVMAINKPRCD